MTKTIPDKFKEQIISINWKLIGMGLVLYNEALYKVLDGTNHGKTTVTNYSEAIKGIEVVIKYLVKAN
eukprot:2635727-Ditylum_brightwellii.AAC.1